MNSKGSAPFFTFLARKLVSAKAKAAIGLEEARLCVSGAAPITKDTLDYFGSLGVHIMEVYGMSENTGPQTCGQARSISHWFPYDPVAVVNADP